MTKTDRKILVWMFRVLILYIVNTNSKSITRGRANEISDMYDELDKELDDWGRIE